VLAVEVVVLMLEPLMPVLVLMAVVMELKVLVVLRVVLVPPIQAVVVGVAAMPLMVDRADQALSFSDT
jgi:hypothetical protein